MSEFEELPFEDQLAWIRRETATGGDPATLVALTRALADVEPLCRLLDRLAGAGAAVSELVGHFEVAFEALPDPALQYLLGAPLDEPSAVEARLELARAAALRWPLERTTALALLYRWLAGADAPFARRLQETARAKVEGGPEGADPRWLFFLDGHHLAALAEDPAWADLLRATTRTVLDRLARAPKSLSQANAETLLSRRVYANAGHFLFELMQNADDAGASRWSVAIGERQTVAVHDGAPFSFLDVVGVCSIGMTTKGRDQIGLFGVGFKSVFEVTDRPRIHSGAFDLEIAHVSMPRAIARRARGGEPAATVLVLPHHERVSPRELTERALAIPPETLMTLPHLRRFSVEGPGEVREAHEEERDGTRRSLRSTSGDRVYEATEDEIAIDVGRSPVLVAASVGADGALQRRAVPGLFAFLPTAERTGVPVLVQARFEVTVDRERLETASERNRALLEAAGRGYAALIERVASEGRAVLEALPAATDVAELVTPLTDALRAALLEVACLPGADGERVAPARARFVEDRLVGAFAALDLGDGRRALACLSRGERDRAAFLGATVFGDDDLRRLLDDRLSRGDAPPGWLGPSLFEVLGESTIADEALRALPLLVAGDGALVAAVDAASAGPAWVELYRGIRPLVSTPELAQLGRRLLARLAPAAFDREQLVGDLAVEPTLLERDDELLTALADAPELLASLSHVPLFRGSDGGRHSADGGIVRLDARLEPLRAALAPQLPLVSAEQARAHAEVVAAALPVFDLAALARAFDEGLGLGREPRRALVSLLDGAATELSASLVRRLAALPLFEDVHGTPRPLVGEGRALVPAHEALLGLLPGWPWLAAEGAFVRVSAPAPFGARSVAEALASGAADRSAIDRARLPPLIDWIGAHAGELRASDVDGLAAAPIWPDVDGRARALERLRVGTSAAAVNAFYSATGLRGVAHPVTARACRRLRLERALPASDHEAVIDDLCALEDLSTMDMRLVGPVLLDALGRVPPDRLADVVELALFEDEAGVRRALGSFRRPDDDRCHRPGPFRALLRRSPRPLLAEGLEVELGPFLDAVGPPAATVVDLARLGEGLSIEPGELLEALLAHADELDAAARDAVARLPLFESRIGSHRTADELGDAGVFCDTLGEAQIDRLGLGAWLMSDASRAAAGRLGLAPRAASAILDEHVLAALREGAPLDAQRDGARTVADLLSLLGLCDRLGLDPSAHALALDRSGRVVRGPLPHGPREVRALAERLPVGSRLADAGWARDPRAASQLEPIGARRIANELRAACPVELPRDAHPVLPDPEALFGWIREHGTAIRDDEAARAALGVAHVVPSQRGTLRAPSELVLSSGGPDLGLAWGMAGDVPADVAAFLGASFEMDRQQRRALVEHVLDGLDEAVDRQDAARVVELVRFLAASLAADDAEQLEQRARRLKVRARLRVPSAEGGFVKPRFGWVPTDETAALAAAFMEAPPPRLGIADLDPATRALLTACGAAPDLSSGDVGRLLSGEGLRGGPTARAALARYVVQRVAREPGLAAEWKLTQRAWVPDRAGVPRPPGELLWPEPAVGALFGDDAGGVPDDLVVSGVSRDGAAGLGFLSVASLTPKQIAGRLAGRVAGPELIELLEAGLVASRFAPEDVAEALASEILLTDDEGVVRPVGDLAVRGARDLFGVGRGDASCLVGAPLLARALSVPRTPDLPMMLEFLEERGARLETLSRDERAELSRHLPEVYRRIAERVRGGSHVVLPAGAAVAAVRDGARQLVSLGEPELRLVEPAPVADALDDGVLDALLAIETAPGLAPMWLAAGVWDLVAGSRVVSVEPGPTIGHRDVAAFHAALVRRLGPAAGRRALVHASLTATIALSLPAARSAFGYRGVGSGETRVTVPVDAALHDGTLHLTEVGLDAPVSIAAALETEPRRRAALLRWLATDLRGELEKRARPAPGPAAGAAAAPPGGLFERIKRFFGGADEPVARPASPRRPRVESSVASDRDASLFRPEQRVRAQLDGGEGWVRARSQRPEFGFRFTPETLSSPWMYAPKLIATVFDPGTQSWRPAELERPVSRGRVGVVRARGWLPKGDSILPVPLYARVEALRPDDATRLVGPSGGAQIRLPAAGSVSFELALGEVPDAAAAHAAAREDATRSFVPHRELPDEVLDFVEDLEETAPLETALAIRDFVRRRYRYDPTYLEDAAVGRWLARVSRGRAHAHVAALHAAADLEHLGAGVCYELNSLTCELLRRAGIPAGIATGWVYADGALSESDHLWCMAFLESDRGEPIWVPIDASTTLDGRALRVPRRPPVRARAPEPSSKPAPSGPRWEPAPKEREKRRRGASPSARPPRGATARSAPRPSKRQRRPPRAELRRLLRYLERRTGRAITDEQRARLEKALQDPRGARAMIERLLDGDE